MSDSDSDSAVSDSDAPPSFVTEFPFLPSPGTDVILRSYDGVDFHLHRAVLSLVSPVFQSMFSLPQGKDSKESSPVVPVHETSVLLDRALRFFYPGAQPPDSITPDQLRDTIEVLVSKYDIQCVTPILKAHLERQLATNPIAVYAVAFTHQWKDVALKAARQTLKLPLRVVNAAAPPELDHIPASAYHNLLYYHTLCGAAARATTEALRWVPAPNDYTWFACGTCEAAKLAWYLADGALHTVRVWFNRYLLDLARILDETPGADIRQDGTMFTALASASKCVTCREKVFQQLPRFVSEELAERVNTVIDEVELKM